LTAASYLAKIDVDPIIIASARKHGVHDADIAHAYDHPIRIYEMDESMHMIIGPTRTGALIEVGVVGTPDRTVVVHAMAARAKFLR
jgi:hypothetical protein